MAKDSLPNVHFGPPNEKLDWRKHQLADEEDDDEVRKPPGSIVKMLKLDPYKLFAPKRDKKPFGD